LLSPRRGKRVQQGIVSKKAGPRHHEEKEGADCSLVSPIWGEKICDVCEFYSQKERGGYYCITNEGREEGQVWLA